MKNKTKITNTRNTIKAITIDSAVIKSTKENYKQHYTHKFDILDEMDQFIESGNCYNSPNM